jgi:hypothetical protein
MSRVCPYLLGKSSHAAKKSAVCRGMRITQSAGACARDSPMCAYVQKSGVLHHGPAKTGSKSVAGLKLQLRHDSGVHRSQVGYSKVLGLSADQEGGGSSCKNSELQRSDAAIEQLPAARHVGPGNVRGGAHRAGNTCVGAGGPGRCPRSSLEQTKSTKGQGSRLEFRRGAAGADRGRDVAGVGCDDATGDDRDRRASGRARGATGRRRAAPKAASSRGENKGR